MTQRVDFERDARKKVLRMEVKDERSIKGRDQMAKWLSMKVELEE